MTKGASPFGGMVTDGAGVPTGVVVADGEGSATLLSGLAHVPDFDVRAGSFSEAVEAVRTGAADISVMDADIWESGLEDEADPPVPVVVLSGGDPAADRARYSGTKGVIFLSRAELTDASLEHAVRWGVERARHERTRARLEALQADPGAVVAELARAEADLAERVKELRTLSEGSRILQRDELRLDDRLQLLVDLLPSGWLYPDVTEARLRLPDLELTTVGFRETPWSLAVDLASPDGLQGRLEVILTAPRPERDLGPFLSEERELLQTLASAVEEALRRESLTRHLTKTIASLDEAVIVIDSGGARRGIRSVNRAGEVMFGWSAGELMGQTTERLHVDREAFLRFGAEGLPALERDGVLHASYPMKRKDGTVFEAEQTVSLLDPARGLEGGAVSVIRDVSETRRAEERLRVLGHEISDVIYVLDPSGTVLFSTPSVLKATGYSRAEFEGMNAFSMVHEDDRAGVVVKLREIAHESEATVRAQYRIRRREGDIRYVESVARNLVERTAVGGILVTSRDVTDRIALEEKLRQSQKLESIGRLAGGIAHDFNNLLTVIRSQSDLLLMELGASDSRAPDVEVIQTAADRAATLTSQLLAFSRDQVLRPRVVDLSTLVRALGPLVERVIGEDIAMVVDAPAGLAPVEIDPGQLEQVVLNLAVNARDAMPRGGTLRIATFAEEIDADTALARDDLQPGAYTVLEVTDTGTGMDEETRSRVFEPFFTTKADRGGTGLGLAMAYGVVRQSGGAMQVTSAPGEGTTFRLRFPSVNAPPEEIQPVRPIPTRRAAATSGTVLLVEDDASVRRVGRRVLELGGFRVIDAADAEAGFDLLTSTPSVDVVLTDLVLPGASGRDLLDRIRDRWPDLPVVVMSGYAADTQGQRANLPPGVPFVQKPFTPDSLISAVLRATTKE